MIAVVPARGGSKGIARKNLRLLNGKPLISYVLNTLVKCELFENIIVTSEDEEILDVATRFPVLIRTRPERLAADDVTLDPVVQDAVDWYEHNYARRIDAVMTIQPTSPLLSAHTVERGVQAFVNSRADCLISVVDATHLMWKETSDGVQPLFTERLNRQWLPKQFRETGAIVICSRKQLEKGSRIGGNITIFPVPLWESIDIDTGIDWLLCSALLNRMTINFIVSGNQLLGLGHIRRALTLADHWLGHDIRFICIDTPEHICDTIRVRNYEITRVSSVNEVSSLIRPGSLVINDILDTSSDYIEDLLSMPVFVVNFEDLGTGSDLAHLVINALYERSNPPPNHKYGAQYECLDERFSLQPANSFRKELKTIIVTFGGADPANLTQKALEALEPLNNDWEIRLVLGPAYQWQDELKQFLHNSRIKERLKIFNQVENMARVMKGADLGITSNGRTVYELAAMGVPMISISQNERETLHLFARYSRGVRYLGPSSVTPEEIQNTVLEIASETNMRRELYDNLPIKELRSGLPRLAKLIESEYKRWRDEKYSNR